ncbi:hypothetical protein BN2476_370018 [Paraburkholderia piptadeniae]|uniref:Uncharacterized protein n=1 Tax=Paraburkholderia piptadeniae TaxID=1701573 RepID=A0A1N7S9I8_9BURK|nr:hypothetical protein BN2476_370018 [Paraburkholderia piptadeniae]
MVAFERWPEDESLPLYLDSDADHRLQEWMVPTVTDDAQLLRNRAIVAYFPGRGTRAAGYATAARCCRRCTSAC